MCCSPVLENGVEKQLYEWFEATCDWSLIEADFYTQYEFVVSKNELPENLECLISDETIETIKSAFRKAFKTNSLETVSVVAHKLVNNHTIGIHNDYINGEETHRLVIQINPHWDATKGGFLMLFNSPRVEDISKIIQPINNSAFGFEISDKSYHAVSTVRNFSGIVSCTLLRKIRYDIRNSNSSIFSQSFSFVGNNTHSPVGTTPMEGIKQ